MPETHIKTGTLGLNLICGSGKAEELERCLKAVRRDLDGEPKLFDQIVIGVNYKDSPDQSVLDVANKYADKVLPPYRWEDDFGKARNDVFKATDTEHMMWLDSDDVLSLESYRKILELKPFLLNYDVVYMPYIYSHNSDGSAQVTLPRERIVRNIPDIKWEHPIHEAMVVQQLDPKKPPFRAKNAEISIDHYRSSSSDPNRNLRILEREYAKSNCPGRLKFYYGKDLYESGQKDRAIPILEDVVSKKADFSDNMAVACVRISTYYHEKGMLDLAKTFAYQGIGFSGKYAEFFVVLGDIFKHENDLDTAIRYYEEALKKKLDAGMSQYVDYYKYLPADRLSIINYYDRKDLEKALLYNTMTLECNPTDERILRNREVILNDLKGHQTLLPDKVVGELKDLVISKGYDFELVHNLKDRADLRIHRREAEENTTLVVRWMIPSMDRSNPSVRIRRMNVNDQMVKMGVDSGIVSNYYPNPMEKVIEILKDASVVIFTQFGDYDYELMKRLKALGKKMCFDHNEGLFNYPLEAECMDQADVVVCVSDKLAEMTQAHGHKSTAVIPDGIE